MALIELNFGGEQTDGDADPDSVEIPIGDEASSSSTGRRLLRATALLAVLAGGAYFAYRRRAERDDSEFAEIVIDGESAETVESSEE